MRPSARRRVRSRSTAITWPGRIRRAKWPSGRRSSRRTTSKSWTGGTDSTRPATASGTSAAVARAVRAPKQLPISTVRSPSPVAQSTAARVSATYGRSRRTISSAVAAALGDAVVAEPQGVEAVPRRAAGRPRPGSGGARTTAATPPPGGTRPPARRQAPRARSRRPAGPRSRRGGTPGARRRPHRSAVSHRGRPRGPTAGPATSRRSPPPPPRRGRPVGDEPPRLVARAEPHLGVDPEVEVPVAALEPHHQQRPVLPRQRRGQRAVGRRLVQSPADRHAEHVEPALAGELVVRLLGPAGASQPGDRPGPQAGPQVSAGAGRPAPTARAAPRCPGSPRPPPGRRTGWPARPAGQRPAGPGPGPARPWRRPPASRASGRCGRRRCGRSPGGGSAAPGRRRPPGGGRATPPGGSWRRSRTGSASTRPRPGPGTARWADGSTRTGGRGRRRTRPPPPRPGRRRPVGRSTGGSSCSRPRP